MAAFNDKKEKENISFKASVNAGAGLEWRAFIKCDKLDVFKALKEKNHMVHNNWSGYIEKRTDNYIVINNNDYGLKFRHGKNLELKCRVESNLNIEGWYKNKFQIKLNEMKLSLLQEKLKKYKNDEELGICLKHIINENSFIVKCSKERINGSVDGLSFEQTKCKIQIIDSKYNKDQEDKKDNNNNQEIEKLNGSEWISVCCEDDDENQVSSILKIAQSVENIFGEIDKNYIIASYPGWLIKLLY